MTSATQQEHIGLRFTSLHTPLVDILDCNYPILCAGMGGVARAQLAAAVSNAGGYGCMGMVREKPDFIRQQIQLYRSLSDANFAVNIIPAATDTALLAEQIQVLLECRVPAVCLFWDVIPEVVRKFLDADITVIHQVGHKVDATLALDAGADILIVQGVDAGGHVRGQQNVYSLLPEICQLSAVPVVAAGGLATGNDIAAAMLLGAQGVCCGTAFLATHESNAHDYHKQRLVDATADDTIHTEIFHINWPESAPVRVLRNSVTDNAPDTMPTAAEKIPIGTQDGQSVYLYSTDSPLVGATGDLEKMALYAGRSCGEISQVCSAAERVNQLVCETTAAFLRTESATREESQSSLFTDVSSSPCLANDVHGDYGGFLNDKELYMALLELLVVVRASAKVCALTLQHPNLGVQRNQLLLTHQNNARSCTALTRSINILGKSPQMQSHDIVENCMAIDDFDARLRRLHAEHSEAARKIGAILPRISQPAIFADLKLVREQLNANIAITVQ